LRPVLVAARAGERAGADGAAGAAVFWGGDVAGFFFKRLDYIACIQIGRGDGPDGAELAEEGFGHGCGGE
jgi:hypothetical protein